MVALEKYVMVDRGYQLAQYLPGGGRDTGAGTGAGGLLATERYHFVHILAK